MWNSLHQELSSLLGELRKTRDIKDAEIGLAVLEILQTHRLPTSIGDESDARTEAALWTLAWWLFVRAPWLQDDQLVLANMALDLVLNAQRSLDQALEDLAELERERERVFLRSRDSALAPIMAQIKPFATLPERPELSTFDAKARVLSAFAIFREQKETLDATRSAIMSTLFDQFGAEDNRPKLQSLYTLGGEEDQVPGSIEDAQRAYEEGELAQALAGFEAILGRDPEHVEALVGRGVIHATTQDVAAALADLDAALALDPNHAIAHINRGLVRYAEEQFEEAIEDFSAALEQDDTLIEAWLNRGSAYAQLGRLEFAERDATKAIELAPATARPRVDRAVVRRAMGNAAGAMKDYAEATGLDPYHADAWAGRGFLLMELGELEAAEHDFSRALALEPWRSVLFYNRGNVHAGLGNMSAAIADYDRVLEIDDDDLEARMNRGTARLKSGDIEGALEDWDRLTRLYPHEPDAYLRRGVVLMMSEEYGFATEDLQKALDVATTEWPMRSVAEEKLMEAREALKKTAN